MLISEGMGQGTATLSHFCFIVPLTGVTSQKGKTMNRIANAVEKMKNNIESRISNGLTTKEKVESLHKSLDMGFDEYVKFQEVKSIAQLNGTLNLDEAMYIYGILGESGPDNFNNQPIEVKVILTQTLMELLQKQVA